MQPITHVTRRITICELHCSLGVTGYVRRLTGGLRVGSLGLFMRFIAILTGLTGVIGRFETIDQFSKDEFVNFACYDFSEG